MLQSSIKDGLHSLQNLSSDDILEALGLQRRRSMLEAALVPSIAMFAAGAAVGAAAALLFAPKAGTALRKELTDTARDYSQRIGATASGVAQDVKDALPFGDDSSKDATRAGSSNTSHVTRRA